MSRILLIGYGNPLRGDDGVGWAAAGQLAALLPDESELLVRHQLLPELALPISQADLVVFIDAAMGERPGQVCCIPIAPRPLARAFSHQCDPAGLLASAGKLFGHCPKAYLVTVTGASFEYGTELSSPVAAALPQLLEDVRRLVEAAD